jgi:hypothetical protein
MGGGGGAAGRAVVGAGRGKPATDLLAVHIHRHQQNRFPVVMSTSRTGCPHPPPFNYSGVQPPLHHRLSSKLTRSVEAPILPFTEQNRKLQY